jgi:hypothetical protein
MKLSLGFFFVGIPAFFSMGCAEGALGQSQASPDCSPSDFVCAVHGLDKPLAAGTSLPVDVSLDLQGSATPPLSLVSGDTAVFTVDGSVLRGEGPGLASLLITIPGNLVVDFFHVWVEQPTAIALHRRTSDGADVGAMPEKLELLVGDELSASVEAFAGSQRLLGEPEATWSTGSAAVQILGDGTPGRRRIVAKAVGATSIHVEAFGAEADLEVEVVP